MTAERDFDGQGLFRADPGAMTLVSGIRVNPLTMRPTDVDIIDIAHALARQCRYNGHCGGYLSVARHSLWVSVSGDEARWGWRSSIEEDQADFLAEFARLRGIT